MHEREEAANGEPRRLKQQAENRDKAGRWKKGESGNRRGRPVGSRHRAILAVEKLMTEGAEDVARAVIEAAQAGDIRAARVVIERITPPVKDRPISAPWLPDTSTAEGCEAGQAAIVAAVAAGDLLPSEGAALGGLIELRRRAIETADLMRRIEAMQDGISEKD